MTPDSSNSTPTPAAPLALRTREAAAALGVSERTLQSLVSTNDIPHVRVGRAVLFPVRELTHWLTVQVKPITSDTDGGER